MFGGQSLRERRFLCESVFIPIGRQTLILKMVEREVLLWNLSFNSFIIIRRMCLWCPIMKRKKIIMWICVSPNKWTTINSKDRRKRTFSYETKASISYIPIRRISLWFLTMKRKDIIMWIHIYPNLQMNFDSKKW